MNLDAILADPDTATTIASLVQACQRAQTNVVDDLEPEHGAVRGDYGYVGHSYRKYEVESLPDDARPGFECGRFEQRIGVTRDDLSIMVVGLGNRPSNDPRSWMPQNQEGWSSTEQRQGDLFLSGVRPRGHMAFVCCILDADGHLESIDLRRPRIDETGYLFEWLEICELLAPAPEPPRDAQGPDDDEKIEVEVRRGPKKGPRSDEGQANG